MLKLSKKQRYLFVFGLLIAVGFLIWLISWTDLKTLLIHVQEIHLGWFLLAAFTVFILNIIKVFRFYYLARDVHIPITLKGSVRAHFIAQIIGRLTPSKLGEGIKIFFLHQDKKKLGFVFLIEKLADTITLITVAVFALYTFGSFYNAFLTLFGIFLIILIAIFYIDKILNFILKRNILEDQWFKLLLAEISPEQWLMVVGFSTIIRFLILSVPYIIAVSLGITISLWLLFQIFTISMIVGSLSGLPGGLGTREVSFSFLLITYAALSKDISIVLVLLAAFTDLIVESIMAVIGGVWYWAAQKK